MLVDLGIKVGLRERGLIALVVAVTAVAIHVDDDVASKFLAKINRELTNEQDRERIVPVHMKNRHLDHLRDVGGIHR